MPMPVEQLRAILNHYDRTKIQSVDPLSIFLVKMLYHQVRHSLLLTPDQEWTLLNCFSSMPLRMNYPDHFTYLACLQAILGEPLNREPWHVVQVLRYMKKAGFYKKKHFEAIVQHRQSRWLMRALLELHHGGIFVEDTFSQVLAAFNPLEMAKALRELAEADLLTPDNSLALQHRRYPSALVTMFKMLHEQHLLLPGNRQWLARQADPWSLALLLRFFRTAGMLVQAHLQQLMRPEHAWILSAQAHAIIWNVLPEALFDAHVFQAFLTYTAFENPLIPLERNMAGFIGALEPNVNDQRVEEWADPGQDSQSTHAASVHRTASESALKLLVRYENPNARLRLDSALLMLLQMEHDQSLVAFRGLRRILYLNADYHDPVSKISLRLLLVLVWTALHDDQVRLGSLDSARQLFLEALYEIQRGNNLSEQGADNLDSEDDFICPAGAFNKLIEKLQGIHPDCTIHYLSFATAAMKLPCVVRATLLPCLTTLAQALTATSALSFTRLIDSLKKEGVARLWPQLVKPVSEAVFAEFHSLYKGMADPKFNTMIAAGKDTELGDFCHFQKPFLQSSGYHAYCQQQLVQTAAFNRPL